jgi:hypothetical protein
MQPSAVATRHTREVDKEQEKLQRKRTEETTKTAATGFDNKSPVHSAATITTAGLLPTSTDIVVVVTYPGVPVNL